MSKLDRNLHALAICYRILGGLVGLVLSFLILLIGATMALAAFEVATALQNHERRTFCLVVAWLVCALFPLGTVLGVFTILQLIQPEAECAFDEAERPYVKMEDFRKQAGSAAEE